MSIGNIDSSSSFIVNNSYKVNLASSKPLDLNNIQNIRTVKNDDITDNILREIENEADPIDREEDLRLYNMLKNNLNKEKHIDLQRMKQMLVCFPPATAPGYVRKAFREALEKLPESQRHQIGIGFTLEYGSFAKAIKDGSFKVNSKQTIYENFQDYINKGFNADPNFLGCGSSLYIGKLFNDFFSEIKNYQ
jgi:hypothetical protein